ncbi:MAG TPA: ABC transporter permease [Nocardioides sp.]|jgi:peptide/nickel transport system permease protein|nr:ABC transporter permease [Nocardioides sp.]
MSLVAEPGLVAEDERSASQPRRRGYAAYVGLKVLGACGSLCFMLVVNFLLFRVLPGDPAKTLGRGRLTSQAQVDAFNKTYGLNEPLPQQFLTFLKNIAHGDLGISLQYRLPVSQLIMDRLWPTLLLVGTSTILAIVIGVYLGIRGAWNRGGMFDRISTGTALTLYSMPEWWLGLLLIAGLGVGEGFVPGLFPTGGLHSPNVDPNSLHGVFDTVWHLVLPVTTLTLAYLADYSLIMRSSLLDELGEDYLQTARAKGLRDVQVRNHHAVRNALLPTTTIIALNIGFVVSGAITVETVFSIPGLGLLSTDAIGVPDFWVLQGTFLVASAGVILANLAANLLYGWLDPRVRT